MLLSDWRKAAPNRDSMNASVLAVLKPVLVDLGAGGNPECWVSWGDDPAVRYSVLASTMAGLVSVSVRVNTPGEGARATGKLIRWSKLQVTELSVDDVNAAAASFYERRGFTEIGRYRQFGALHRRLSLRLAGTNPA